MPQDLRSPDTRDAALEAEASQPQDLRSPDTRDAALGYAPAPLGGTAGVPPAPVRPAADSFEWGDAGIGAAATLCLLSVAGGTVLLVRRNATS